MNTFIKIFAFALVHLLIGSAIGGYFTQKEYKIHAIQSDCGFYHPDTGQFIWKDEALDSE